MYGAFEDLCLARHSIRKFTEDPVTDAQVERILNIVQLAPSAGNLQAYEIVIVKDPVTKTKLAEAAGQRFVETAPVVLVFNALLDLAAFRYKKRGEDLYALQDATIACTYAMLAATSIGLASVWVGSFDDDQVRKITGAGDKARPVAILPIGFQNDISIPKPRKSIEKLSREI